ncbi:hypothetical protein FRC07_008215 [Ceratobasidium sp. 392]|nr:hypothetical protein FRC07_008215 [Ceratobasidium sp. 392]
MFISDADALDWIGSKAGRESVCPETGGADARKQTENSQGEMPKPKGKAADDQGGWTFHSPESAPDPPRGYLYNAYHRLVAIGSVPDLDLNTFVKPFQAMPNYDEYTEIVVVTPKTTEQSTSRADSNTSTDAWDLYFVDHFNRRFLTLKDFKKRPNEICSGSTTFENAYREWMKLVASGNSHYFMPWPDNKKQCLGRKIAQQIVWDYQTAHVVKDVDIEGAFSISDCSSLLSALQKKRPLLHVPFPYFRRLRLLSTRADEGEYVPDLWKTFIKSVLKEWTDLNIIIPGIANVG